MEPAYRMDSVPLPVHKVVETAKRGSSQMKKISGKILEEVRIIKAKKRTESRVA